MVIDFTMKHIAAAAELLLFTWGDREPNTGRGLKDSQVQQMPTCQGVMTGNLRQWMIERCEGGAQGKGE